MGPRPGPRALTELRRVLRPSGELRFCEHVIPNCQPNDCSAKPSITAACGRGSPAGAVPPATPAPAIERAGFEIPTGGRLMCARSSSTSPAVRCAVGELARGLPVSRAAVSQHLRVVKQAGLVIDRPAANRRMYEVNRDGLAKLRADLDQFWSSALAA